MMKKDAAAARPARNVRTEEELVRVGVFRAKQDAEVAVSKLLDVGFAPECVTVVADEETRRRWLEEFERDRPAGERTPGRATAGSVFGGIAGGLVGLVGVATGGPAAILLAPVFVGTGAAAGTFIGAMTSRGVEREVANYYDQALRRGDILVAAEIEKDGDRTLLDSAERVFREVGARPVPLPEG
jgi:uncharacterized protein YcfJ